MNGTALLHLLQLASPSLPIGAYSYSQGLETAIERGSVRCPDSAARYLARQLGDVLAPWDGAVFWRLLAACRIGNSSGNGAEDSAGGSEAFWQWNARYLASRESAELRAETVQMGYSLTRLLMELNLVPSGPMRDTCLPAALAQAVHALGVPHEEALLAMLFSWTENQVLVCVKSIPLGQVAGQRLLLGLRPAIEQAAAQARSLPDDELSSWAPGLAQLSMYHEIQSGRLYRS
ncbi:urease accessory protein [Massilia sp. UYP11]|uniref:urease accessory protein UreF n=1 Tax=Massilia sp. UYP11 TaxID=1756385 RepID=UPI003D1B32B0